jgi:hypothetical protein
MGGTLLGFFKSQPDLLVGIIKKVKVASLNVPYYLI